MSDSSPRRHARIGLVLAAFGGALGGWLLLSAGRTASVEARAGREAVISARSVADVVERAGFTGDAVRSGVARLAKADSALQAVRVVILAGLSLEASTAPEDSGDRAAPRRLLREEKDLFDQGQRLRAAIESNREEKAARKEEVETRPLPGGGLAVAAPLEKNGEVIGFVQLQTAAASAEAPRPPLLPAFVAFAAPILVFWGLSLLLKSNRVLLTVVAVACILSGLLYYRASGAGTISADRRSAEAAVAAHLGLQSERVNAALTEAGLTTGAPPDPASWDVDAFRRPRGLISAAGAVDSARLEEAVRRAAGAWSSVFWFVIAGSLAVLLLFSSGAAARIGRILVQNRQAYFYILPAMLAMLVLVFFPFFYGIALSFTNQTIYNTDKSIPELWVGLSNFKDILTDFHVVTKTAEGWVFNYQNFYWTLFVTVVWTITNVSIGVSVGLALALMLNTRRLALRPIYRVLLILPWAVPNYITALIWKGMFHQQFGVVNQVIQMFGGAPVSWFDKPFTAFLTCLATNGWLSFPFMMVISLGALQSIPADLYEAARVDGASRWRQFTGITLPSLKPALVPAVILSVVWTFNMFNIIYLVSNGDPAHSTEILITQAYKLAFEQYRYGYAAAYSVVIFLILLVYGTWQNRVTRATEGI